jgi:hypothetical protein
MHPNSETQPDQSSAPTPEGPPVLTAKPRKRSKPTSKKPAASAEEAPATDAVRPIKTQQKVADGTAKRQLRASTKKGQLITLLSSRTGADVASLSAALGWLPHTTRAAMTMLRKAGYGLEADKPKGGGAGRYRIVAKPATIRGAA